MLKDPLQKNSKTLLIVSTIWHFIQHQYWRLFGKGRQWVSFAVNCECHYFCCFHSAAGSTINYIVYIDNCQGMVCCLSSRLISLSRYTQFTFFPNYFFVNWDIYTSIVVIDMMVQFQMIVVKLICFSHDVKMAKNTSIIKELADGMFTFLCLV